MHGVRFYSFKTVISDVNYLVGLVERMILGISGSPKNGNSEAMLREALKIASERGHRTESILCSKIKVGPCIDCGECSRKNPCPIKDDMPFCSRLLEQADGIIVVSPVYFGSMTSQLKAVFDRTLPFRRQGMKLKNKIGCALSVGGSRNGGQEKTIETIHSWMHIHGMIVVADDSHFGGIAVRPATEDEVGMNTVRQAASKLCDTVEMIRKKEGCFQG
jgi:multimeric flavodoxin WrbA